MQEEKKYIGIETKADDGEKKGIFIEVLCCFM